MTLNLERCTIDEICTDLGGNRKLLNELRENLQKWLNLQPHLPHDMPKERMENLIMMCKLSLEKAKRKLDMYYTLRSHVPELFGDRDPRGPSVTRIHNSLRCVCLPKLTPEKYRVHVCTYISDDPYRFDLWHTSKLLGMIYDVRLSECHAKGDVHVYDLANIRLSFLTRISPTIMKKSEVSLSECFSTRIKAIHLINAPPYVERLLKMARSVLKPKITERIHVYRKEDMDAFYQAIPRSVMPKDYGGDELSMDELHGLWCAKFEEWRDWFIEQEKIVVNENLRSGPPLNNDDLFGFSGSFRKLDVD